jgi:hypothetical protein
MHLYISKAGAVEGPHSLEVIQTMLRQGRLSPTDFGAVPGADDWKPLAELIDCAPGAGGPPPMPAAPPAPDLDSPFSIDGMIPHGTGGKTVRQITEEVRAGGRFVIYQFVFSIIIMSFRRNASVTYVPPGTSGAGPALGWSLITMACGWWGIPWGIIYSIGALWRNAAGGVDVTEPVLAPWIGPAKADEIVRLRPKRPSGGLWAVRAMILSPLLLVAMMIVLAFIGAANESNREAAMPGHAEFERANATLMSADPGFGGNSDKAIAAAGFYQNVLETTFDEAGHENLDFQVWCQLSDDRCMFLVCVPTIRKYSPESQKTLYDTAWLCANLTARHMELAPREEIAVAVRGMALYGCFIGGKFLPDANPENEDYEKIVHAAIAVRDEQPVDKKRIIPFFAPAAP